MRCCAGQLPQAGSGFILLLPYQFCFTISLCVQCKSDFETVDLSQVTSASSPHTHALCWRILSHPDDSQASIDFLRRVSGSGTPTGLSGSNQGTYCEVKPRHSADESFILKATTAEEMQRWVLLMQQQSQHHRENDRILLFEHLICTIAAETFDVEERAWFEQRAAADSSLAPA